MTLFDLPPGPPELDLSETRRRTRRNRALIDSGIHPATRLAFLEGPTCGGCIHATGNRYRTRTYWKCDLVPMTFGAGTDIRLSWPACVRFERDAMPDGES